jgi:Conserved TM helix
MELLDTFKNHFDPQAAYALGEKAIGILVILAITWALAKGVKWGFAKIVDRVPLLQRAGGGGESVGNSLGKIVGLVIWLLGLIAILQRLGLDNVIKPIQTLLDQTFTVVPAIVGAAIIFFVGMMVAKIVRQIVETTLSAADVDGWAQKAGLAKITGDDGVQAPVSALLGTLAFVAVAIPVSIGALDVLGIQSVSEPAKNVLQTILNAIPLLVGAALLLGITYFIARWVGGLIEQILPSLGFDNTVQSLGIVPSTTVPSKMVSTLSVLAIMLFAAIEATKLLNFSALSEILDAIITLGGKVLFGGVIIAVGAALARIMSGLIGNATGEGGVAGPVVYYAIIFLFVAMGLKYMGIADSIVNMAFGAIVIGGSVAAALAFGLGGRDAAARLLENANTTKKAAATTAAKTKAVAKK